MANKDAVPLLNGEVLVEQQSIPDRSTVHESTDPTPNGVPKDPIECDVLVVGAGFSGMTAIDRVRKLGLNVKCFESGTDVGGVWYWNRYPGARVDSETPWYQLNIPEVYRDWTFTQRFPDHRELRKYARHIKNVLKLDKDIYFSARVNDCSWDKTTHRWTIKTLQGHVAVAKYLISCSGLLHRTYTPEFPGLNEYKGEVYHSGAWSEDYDGRGKKIAIIGAGATAVQITQELGKQAKELTVFLRRPSYCLAMKQRDWSEREQKDWKPYYPSLFQVGRDSAVGFPTQRHPARALDLSQEERDAFWEELWERGGFHFQLGSFPDVGVDREANKLQYDFWRKKVCKRLTDPEKQKIMAPENPPYFWGTKRSPLERDYYEVLNQPNVSIHDLKAQPLKSFNSKGLITSDDKLHEFDTIVFATGFDSYTGSLTKMGLKNVDGVDLKDLWQDGINTYLGLTMTGFPNFFIAYSPQAPTALSNGPTIIEAQVESIVDMIQKLETEKIVSIEPKREAEIEWKAKLDAMTKHTLFPFTDSWWNGANIPNKKAENMLYIGGINMYEKEVRATFDGWHGFNVVPGAA